MMQNPFFRNHVPSFPFETTSRGYRGDAPIRQRQTNSEFRSSPKVVSIPVHFVESENTRSVAALRIQKVFRGFLVRKNVKKIFTIKREVDEIENRISLTVDSIREDAKERLKINEMLMAVLFRLDSVRGIDSGVRDCRRAVIKKAIMLQERLDAIVSGDETLVPEAVSEPQQVEEHLEDANYQTMEIDIKDHVSGQEVSECNAGKDTLNSLDESAKDKCEIIAGKEGGALTAAEEEGEEVIDVPNLEELPIPLETEKNDQNSIEEHDEEYLLVKKEDDDAMKVQQSDLIVEDKGEIRDENKELMERMIERNEVLIGLVRELCEKNNKQTQMITCLSKRVDNLEKAFKIERSKCKKRK